MPPRDLTLEDIADWLTPGQAIFWRLFGLTRNDGAGMNYVLLPAAVVAVKTSLAARSGVSSFQRTDPNGRSSMRRTLTGSGPI